MGVLFFKKSALFVHYKLLPSFSRLGPAYVRKYWKKVVSKSDSVAANRARKNQQDFRIMVPSPFLLEVLQKVSNPPHLYVNE